MSNEQNQVQPTLPMMQTALRIAIEQRGVEANKVIDLNVEKEVLQQQLGRAIQEIGSLKQQLVTAQAELASRAERRAVAKKKK